MTFKQLPKYVPFEFDRTGVPFGNSLAKGPWIKISPRKYVKATNPFSLKADERQEHQENIGLEYQVGSINVEVNIID